MDKPSPKDTENGLDPDAKGSRRSSRRNSETIQRRKALRDFYKLQQQQQHQQDASANQNQAHNVKNNDGEVSWFDENLMDSENLPISADSVDEYVQKLVKTSDIKQLLHTENQLLSLIRGLDSEQKALVYNNYNKLITTSNMLDKHMNNAKELAVLNDLPTNLQAVTDILSAQNITIEKTQLQTYDQAEDHKDEQHNENAFLIRRQVKWLLQVESRIRQMFESHELAEAKKTADRALELVNLWLTKTEASAKLSAMKVTFESLAEEAQNKLDFASSS